MDISSLKDAGLGFKTDGFKGKVPNKAGSVDAQFARKYKVTLNQIQLAEKRLNMMLKNGGGQILSKEKYDRQIKKKLEDLALKCQGQKYSDNLDAKLDFINFKIELLTSDAVKAEVEAEQKKAEEQFKEENSQVEEFLNKLIKAYNEAGADSAGDNTEVKMKALEDEKKKIKEEIDDPNSGLYDVYDESSPEYIEAVELGLPTKPDENLTKKNKEKAKKDLDKAYDQAKKGVEAANNIAEQNAKKVLAMCEKSLKLPDEELSKKAQIKAEKALQQAAAQLSKLPDDMIKQFKQIENLLQTLITGFGDLNFMVEDGLIDAEAYVDKMIASLQSLMDPVFNTATALALPLPPIVAPVKDLLAMIPQMGKDPPGISPEQKALIEKYKTMKIQIPQDWLESLKNMKDSLLTVMGMFPVCLVQLIFNMIDALVGQILALGGAAPYPLNLIPLAIQLMPKLFMLYLQFPQIFYKIIEKKFKDMMAQAMALGTSLGSSVNGITVPTPQCSEAAKAELLKKMEAKKKADDEQKALKKAQKMKEREEQLKNSAEYQAAQYHADDAKAQEEKAKKDAELLAQIESTRPKTVEEKEDLENKKLCEEIIAEASRIHPNNTDDQPKDLANTPDDELSEDEKAQKKAESTEKS